MKLPRRRFLHLAAAAATLPTASRLARAQSGSPIKIGFSMSMTGGLAANGKSALLAQKIWEEDVNAKGGLSSTSASRRKTPMAE